jgi:ABC-type multidrug transport system fused ATPase/permease subunit
LGLDQDGLEQYLCHFWPGGTMKKWPVSGPARVIYFPGCCMCKIPVSLSLSRTFLILIQMPLVSWMPNCSSKQSKNLKCNKYYHSILYNSNINNINKGIGFQLAMLIGAMVTATTGVSIALFINWKLTVIMLCLMPLFIYASHHFSRVSILFWIDLTCITLNSSSLMRQWVNWTHIQERDKSFKKYLVLFALFFHSTVVYSNKTGRQYALQQLAYMRGSKVAFSVR